MGPHAHTEAAKLVNVGEGTIRRWRDGRFAEPRGSTRVNTLAFAVSQRLIDIDEAGTAAKERPGPNRAVAAHLEHLSHPEELRRGVDPTVSLTSRLKSAITRAGALDYDKEELFMVLNWTAEQVEKLENRLSEVERQLNSARDSVGQEDRTGIR